MKKLILGISFLLQMGWCGLVFSAPTSNLSITPTATDGTTITASDENTRNNATTTWANAHDHDDIDIVGNTLGVGDGAAGNKTIQARNADSNKPFIRFDDTNNRWLDSNDGSTSNNLVIQTGSTLSNFILPQSPVRGNLMFHNGVAWDLIDIGTNDQFLTWHADRPRWQTMNNITISSFTRDMSTASGIQAITGVGFQPRAVIFLGVNDNASPWSVGLDNGSTSQSIRNEHGATADTSGIDAEDAISLVVSGGAQYEGNISALGTDGFTITWLKTGSPTGDATIYFMAFK